MNMILLMIDAYATYSVNATICLAKYYSSLQGMFALQLWSCLCAAPARQDHHQTVTWHFIGLIRVLIWGRLRRWASENPFYFSFLLWSSRQLTLHFFCVAAHLPNPWHRCNLAKKEEQRRANEIGEEGKVREMGRTEQ